MYDQSRNIIYIINILHIAIISCYNATIILISCVYFITVNKKVPWRPKRKNVVITPLFDISLRSLSRL